MSEELLPDWLEKQRSQPVMDPPWSAAWNACIDHVQRHLAERSPFAWTDGVSWHGPAHRAVMASVRLGKWLSAAIDDPDTCEAMKDDIREWFSAGEPMETLCQALALRDLQRQREGGE